MKRRIMLPGCPTTFSFEQDMDLLNHMPGINEYLRDPLLLSFMGLDLVFSNKRDPSDG